MKIHILTIGDEILIGQIIDTNSAWIGQQLNANGGQIIGITSVADDYEDIQRGLAVALEKSDAVLITGGLGPTKDDITKKTLADFFKVDMVFSQSNFDWITKIFKKFGRDTTPAHRAQCYMPSNAVLLHNKRGTAPGMWFNHGKQVIVSMPGVPHEMKYLMEYEVIPRLTETFQSDPIAHRTILTVGEGESRIAARIESLTNTFPKNVKVAYLPGLGRVRIRLTAMDKDEVAINTLLDDLQTKVVSVIPELVYGYEIDTLEEIVGKMLVDKNLTLATAESCTGGYLSHLITSVSGSSAYFMGGVVAYSNEIKMRQLNVPASILEEHGAVSEATVRAMVTGVLDLLKTDIAVSISGIAGPTGGTAEKPVGTIWMAVGNKDQIKTRKINLGKDRVRNIQYTGVSALNLIRQFIINL